jgi:hypothetical protein
MKSAPKSAVHWLKRVKRRRKRARLARKRVKLRGQPNAITRTKPSVKHAKHG